MAALIHARRFRHTLDLIDQLPKTSRLKVAIVNDDELFEDIPLPEEGELEDTGPDLAEWDMTVEMLASVYDALNTLIAVTIQVNSEKKRPFPKPLPRPQTAIDRARERRRKAAQEEILSIFAPGR
ncbi:hypothetical protein [Flaviflexus massiliensis]|uniref:hypothetical protein n=1 Tax=Flaviflexus massiliensis TaxID=1522309 RepID=UPI0006D545A0|nr:hypothetical protein [Flaviflexus massiliensis]